MNYYLGIDGGGTKTTCVIGDEKSILASVTKGPSNITRVGELVARESLHGAIQEACAAAGIVPGQLKNSCIGAAGAGRAEVAQSLRKIMADILSASFVVVGDMEIAMHAAFKNDSGIVVIAGTGSIAYGRNQQGRTARAGGWGFSISDEGSAYWVGRQAVAEILSAWDRSPDQNAERALNESPLFQELKTTWKFASLDQLARTANSHPNFAELFRPVVAACEAGDQMASSVLIDAARELGNLCATVARKLFIDKSAQAFIPLAMAGGVFRNSNLVCKRFAKQTVELNAGFRLETKIVDPVKGALELARAQANPTT